MKVDVLFLLARLRHMITTHVSMAFLEGSLAAGLRDVRAL